MFIWINLKLSQSKGKTCKLLSFEKTDTKNTKLTCQVPEPDAAVADYYGNRGITLLVDNGYKSLANLRTATPSVNATKSEISKASFKSNSSTESTIWLKGFLIPGKTSTYEFTVKTNGEGVLYISTDSTSARKVEIASSSSTKGTLNLTANTP